MYNITLISSFHSEIGKCNSEELHNIISSIKPEVIFEELSESLFNKIYIENRIPDKHLNQFLEIKCIKNYIPIHIKHVPVDIDPNTGLSCNKIKYIFSIFKKHTAYQDLEDELKCFIEQGGFNYLNSEKCSDLFSKKKMIEQNLLASGISSVISVKNMYKQFQEKQNNRENAIVSNIYDYGRKNPYNQAVFLIGCAHRNSIVSKIIKYNNQSDFKLNWTFYNITY